MATNLANKEETNENTIEDNNTKKEARRAKKQVRKQYQVRKFPIWLRIIVVLILFVLCLIIGVIVGYGVIGDGNLTEALDLQTWQHILDIVQKE
ncbi:DNA-directed RNA polymerase subunit beta [Pseudogracilibacillus sp. SO30301A]|uniref:DNA-directed RNA polymerase subunit beta n=1 Tax=Pseudogracilibacillus sp. SO30301A TaxID=3098291 RepID=UPI00300E3827